MNEIERKFLARFTLAYLADPLDKYLRVKQGYIVAGAKVEWRVRRTNYAIPNKGVKWHTALKFGNGYVRKEYEWRVPALLGWFLGLLVPNWLEKTRVSKEGWELDIFHGDLDGLQLAEYEVAHANDPAPPTPEGLLLVLDVTEAGVYANKFLSRLKPDVARKFVKTSYPPRVHAGRFAA